MHFMIGLASVMDLAGADVPERDARPMRTRTAIERGAALEYVDRPLALA